MATKKIIPLALLWVGNYALANGIPPMPVAEIDHEVQTANWSQEYQELKNQVQQFISTNTGVIIPFQESFKAESPLLDAIKAKGYDEESADPTLFTLNLDQLAFIDGSADLKYFIARLPVYATVNNREVLLKDRLPKVLYQRQLYNTVLLGCMHNSITNKLGAFNYCLLGLENLKVPSAYGKKGSRTSKTWMRSLGLVKRYQYNYDLQYQFKPQTVTSKGNSKSKSKTVTKAPFQPAFSTLGIVEQQNLKYKKGYLSNLSSGVYVGVYSFKIMPNLSLSWDSSPVAGKNIVDMTSEINLTNGSTTKVYGLQNPMYLKQILLPAYPNHRLANQNYLLIGTDRKIGKLNGYETASYQESSGVPLSTNNNNQTSSSQSPKYANIYLNNNLIALSKQSPKFNLMRVYDRNEIYKNQAFYADYDDLEVDSIYKSGEDGFVVSMANFDYLVKIQKALGTVILTMDKPYPNLDKYSSYNIDDNQLLVLSKNQTKNKFVVLDDGNGFLAGDEITMINDLRLQNLTLEQVYEQALKSGKNSSTKVEVIRDGKPVVFTVFRV